jgi:hypothetical protein
MTSQRTEAPTIIFQPEDLVDRVPPAGWYSATVAGVWKRPVEGSSAVAVKVKFVLIDDGDFQDVELWDQFVVEGVSGEGEAVARRRLARLFRAAGIEPAPKTKIVLTSIEGLTVMVKVIPDSFQGQPRARISAYRPLSSSPDTE